MQNSWDMLQARASLVQQHQAAFQQVQQPVMPQARPVFLPPSRHDQLMALANSEMGEYGQYAEIHRICNLPVIQPMTPEEFEHFNRTHLLAEAYAMGFRFFVPQAHGIQEYERVGGFFGPIGVGFGKTLLAYACASVAYQKGIRKIVYLVPPSVYTQNAETDLRWARSKIPIPYPVHRTGGKDIAHRRNLAKSDKPGLYIMPYSQLSTSDAEELLWSINPGLLILDECHALRHQGSARTKRLFAFIRQHKPEIVAESGTITNKSVRDYHHIISHALDTKSPLPLSTSLATEWAAVLDADADEEGSATGPLLPLIQWAQIHYPQEAITEDRSGFRRAYKLRLNSCPGVVSTGDADIGVSLSIQNRPVENYENYANWAYLQKLMQAVTEEWVTPNGDEIEHAIHTWKWLNELTAGFFNQLTWPSVDAFAERKRVSPTEAEDILHKAILHHEALQDYHKLLRRWLQDHHYKGLDTPFLVGQDMNRNGNQNVPTELFDAWTYARSLDFEGRPDRDSTAIRVCDYKINDACIWASQLPKGTGGIIWVHHNAIGKWVYEYLCHFGFNAMHCPSGKQYNAAILDAANKDKIVVASISAHGEGKNLQHFQHQYVLQWPRSASKSEQMLGRTHRNGQLADEIVVSTNNTIAWDDMNFAACLNDALYIHQTTGNRQKMIYAGYHPLPVIFSSAFLIERGLEATKLSTLQETMLQDKFGG